MNKEDAFTIKEGKSYSAENSAFAINEGESPRETLTRLAERKFGGTPGQVMFIMRDSSEGDNSRFIPLNKEADGDWRELHDQATADIVVAHSWFRALSGLDFSSGFSSERILQEYELALNTGIPYVRSSNALSASTRSLWQSSTIRPPNRVPPI